ncbi:MAG TPA: hypothetical protein VJZ27_19510 [Aggregatilineales bacterium]|nr:hypothetical protein [Aggregatilineales bacterium]
MSREHPQILYIGDLQRAEAFRMEVESVGWAVFAPSHLMEALAMYISYMPDLIVLDTCACGFWEAVYAHLRSVHARPILLLTERSRVFDGVTADFALPADMPPHDLMIAISGWVYSMSQLLQV